MIQPPQCLCLFYIIQFVYIFHWYECYKSYVGKGQLNRYLTYTVLNNDGIYKGKGEGETSSETLNQTTRGDNVRINLKIYEFVSY